MQLAPLRPRRRRSADRPVQVPPAVAPAATSLSAVAARIAGLIDGPVPEALVVMLTELYGDALARILSAIAGTADEAVILDRLCADSLVSGLLVVHDLHPHTLTTRVERAVAAFVPTPANAPAVVLDRIEDDVVYLRLSAGLGALERNAITRAIAEVAPEIARVCADVAFVEAATSA